MQLEHTFPDPDRARDRSPERSEFARELAALERATHSVAQENTIPLNLPTTEEAVTITNRLAVAGFETNAAPNDWIALGDAMIYRPGLGSARIGKYGDIPAIAAIYLRPGATKHETLLLCAPDHTNLMDIACGIYWNILNQIQNMRVYFHTGIDVFARVENTKLEWFNNAHLNAAIASAKERIAQELTVEKRRSTHTQIALTNAQSEIKNLAAQLQTEQQARQQLADAAYIPVVWHIFGALGLSTAAYFVSTFSANMYHQLRFWYFRNY